MQIFRVLQLVVSKTYRGILVLQYIDNVMAIVSVPSFFLKSNSREFNDEFALTLKNFHILVVFDTVDSR